MKEGHGHAHRTEADWLSIGTGGSWIASTFPASLRNFDTIAAALGNSIVANIVVLVRRILLGRLSLPMIGRCVG